MPTLRVGDVQLSYELRGQGPPVVFIHGLGSSARDWEAQVVAFAPTYQTLAFDLRGHGGSSKPPGPYSMAQFAADTAGLMTGLGLAPAHVVGLSLGGGIAFQLAADHPALVRSLVIVNSGPALLARTLQEKLVIWQRLAIVRLLGMRAMGQTLSKRLFPKPEHADIRATFVQRWAENDQAAYLASFRAMVGWSVLDKLPGIRQPTLIVAADQDYTPVAVKEAYAKLMPNARVAVLPDARHAAPVEVPDRFNQVVLDFLAQQS